MTDFIGYFIYQNFGAEGPYQKLKKEHDYGQKVILYENGYNFTMCYFYLAAGALSLILAFLYWFGRQRKTLTEWASVGIRVFGGICLSVGIISPLTENGSRTGFRFNYPHLIIPIVALGFLLIIIVDNVVKTISERQWAAQNKRGNQQTDTTLARDMEAAGTATGYRIPKSDSRKVSSNLHGVPEMVDHEDNLLVCNLQKRGMKVCYAELHQEEIDVPPCKAPHHSPQKSTQHSLYPHPGRLLSGIFSSQVED